MSGFPPAPSRRYSSSADLYAAEQDVYPQRPTYTAAGTSFDEDERAEKDDEPWTTSYSDFRQSRAGSNRYSQAAPTLISSASYKALDMVEQPMLAKEDWQPGEDSRELHAKSTQRKEQIRNAPGKLGAASRKAVPFFKRFWKWLLAGFLLLAVTLTLLLYFLLPRYPSVDFWRTEDSPLLAGSADPFGSSTYGNYSFTSDLHVAINAEASWLSVHYDAFRVELRLLETNEPVAHGPNTGLEVPGKKTTVYAIPITWEGQFGNGTDPTYAAIFSACQQEYPTVTRSGLNLTMTVTGSVRGRIGSHTTDPATIMNVPCPVEFSGSSA